MAPARSSVPAIEARGLGRSFGDHVAVDGVDVTVAPGEVLGFLGPNGAGKTTTVRMLAGLLPPSRGTARVAGFEVTTEAASVRASVGLLTETPGLYETLPAHRNLRLFAELYGVDDPEPKIRRWLERFGLWGRRNDPSGSFSKGMRQKLAIIRAVLHEPPVIFLDEPTSGLDPEASIDVRDAIEELCHGGATVFLGTHNLVEAERLCDRVAVFKQRILAIDRIDALRTALFGRHLRLVLRAAPDEKLAEALTLVQTFSGVGAVTPVTPTEILAEIPDPAATHPALVAALAAAGVPLLYVQDASPSLEAVYRKLLEPSLTAMGGSS